MAQRRIRGSSIMNDYAPYLCGFQKCGLNSLIKWFETKGITNIHTTEDITSINCIPTFKPFQDKCYPIAIIRDKVEAVWSTFWFFGYYKQFTLEEFLKIDKPSIQYGNENPCNRVDYDYHLSKFEKYVDVIPVVYNLDEMRKLSGFTKENTTQEMFDHYEKDGMGKHYRPINKEDRITIKKALKDYDRESLEFKVKLI